MGRVTHQTARLSRGRHRSPDEGVCAIELVSLLVGGPFTDRCGSVCPAIAAFVRGYNDHIDDRRRQGLLRIAPLLVDTRAGDVVAAARGASCLAFAHDDAALRRIVLGPPAYAFEDPVYDVEVAGHHAARRARLFAGWHERTLGFVEGLAAGPHQPGASVRPPLAAGDRPVEAGV